MLVDKERVIVTKRSHFHSIPFVQSNERSGSPRRTGSPGCRSEGSRDVVLVWGSPLPFRRKKGKNGPSGRSCAPHRQSGSGRVMSVGPEIEPPPLKGCRRRGKKLRRKTWGSEKEILTRKSLR